MVTESQPTIVNNNLTLRISGELFFWCIYTSRVYPLKTLNEVIIIIICNNNSNNFSLLFNL